MAAAATAEIASRTAEIESEAWSRKRSATENRALVARHAHLVNAIAYRIILRMPRSVELDDLIQNGMVGLIEAAQRYASRPGSSFVGYAERRIRGAILDAARRSDWCSRSLRRRLRLIDTERRRIEGETGRAAPAPVIAAAAGLTLDEYHRLMRDRSVSIQESLDAPGCTVAAQASAEPADSRESASDEMEREGKLTALLAAIEELPQLERDVFSLYHDQEYRMREIGVILDLSESRISQIHKRAIEMLRAAAAAATR